MDERREMERPGTTWLSTLVVARVLGPDAYGLVGMAVIYMDLPLW